MAQVKGKGSSAEMTVRRLVHRMGYRYRLHGGKLPGRPDLVFPGRRKAIFVHGCFWHRHPIPPRHCGNLANPLSSPQMDWGFSVGVGLLGFLGGLSAV
jgi:DNA mismatch endonuclease Vsr